MIHGATDLNYSWKMLGIGWIFNGQRKAFGIKIPFTSKRVVWFEKVYDREIGNG